MLLRKSAFVLFSFGEFVTEIVSFVLTSFFILLVVFKHNNLKVPKTVKATRNISFLV